MARLDVPAGTVFGRWTVIGETRASDGKRAMICRCECGTERVIKVGNLRAGYTRSCGCAAHGPLPDASLLKVGEVPLGGSKAAGRVALVDEADYELAMQYRWHVFETERNGRPCGPYARSGHMFMHTLLTGSLYVDHADLNGLNNRRSNLRPATISQNNANQRPRLGAASRFKGVTLRRTDGYWQARIIVNGRRRSLGYFRDEEQAARAYDVAALEVHGEFAYLNFPEAS